MILAFVIVIIALIYFSVYFYFFKGLKKSSDIKGNDNNIFPFISVIVAARNESDNITSCINSLKSINYPSNKFEVIIVNDNSSDNTEELIIKGISGRNNFLLLNSSENKKENLFGKVKALDYAISISKGNIILTTDADCTVNKNWLRNIAKYYTSDTAMVSGFTLIHPVKLLDKIQSLDWMYLQGIACASSGHNRQLSCIGNNLSFSKKAYIEVGGYDAINFSVTEDLALLKSIQKLKQYKIVYPLAKDNFVITLPCNTLRELLNQKKRWFRGGFGIRPLGYFLGLLMYISNLIFLLGIFFIPVNIYLIFILLKFLSDLMIIYPIAKNFNLLNLLWFYPLFEIYFALYGLSLPFTFITGKNINWKNRKF